ncbi:Tigger transposable element-derived protein 6 [Dictyocoela muelleri]|nr:Tigger transposable element-derived protein 6 [Dictyocoela muelleri]
MTGELFTGYLRRLNEYMLKRSRKILLLLDNAPSHPVLNFSNIELFYFPKNTTSVLQPLDMGIIKAFKNHYSNALITSIDYNHLFINDITSLNSLNIKDAIILIYIAWDKISEETIINCF